ncbi:MAG: GNAT family N-acetyltransferase [Candidatus Heimdallarchaeota archaeon]|nr:GNAT family N-acetyltransferase [Candidatus Heimdallarchaeota archaeon]
MQTIELTKKQLVEIDKTEIRQYITYFEKLEEFRAIIVRQVSKNSGTLFVDDISDPSILVYLAGIANVVVDLRKVTPTKEDRDLVKSVLRNQKLLVSNSDNWYIEFEKIKWKTFIRKGQRELFENQQLDQFQLQSKLEQMTRNMESTNYELKCLTNDDVADLESSFKREFSMVDTLEDIIGTQMLFGIFHQNILVGCAGPAHIPINGEFEGQLIINKEHRRKGLGTWLILQLLITSLNNELKMIWDADNTKSANMAEKLGYTSVKKYDMMIYLHPLLKLLVSVIN